MAQQGQFRKCPALNRPLFVAVVATLWPLAAFAQDALPVDAQDARPAVPQYTRPVDPLVVTATRVEERAFDLPVSIDSVGATRIQQDQLQINLSESLSRVPGLSVQSRWNYAQDLQISSRGFGARASFGARGIRLFQDNIPATMPDGQGQTGSFSLVSAQRIEVLRGPFSTLYGNASGGVVSVFTEDGPPTPTAQFQVIGGTFGTWNTIGKFEGTTNGLNYVIAANDFRTDGYRDHSEASRDQFNAKLRFAPDSDTRVTLVANALRQPEAQDPLGLTRAEYNANPRQADPVAIFFDTRKTVEQQQGGMTIEHDLSADTTVRVTGYAGHRAVSQYLALSGIADTSSGGVTDLDGNFGGADARVSRRFMVGGGPLLLTVGATYDAQDQARKGYVNNRGVLGDLRRDETDKVHDQDFYAQAEWSPIGAFSVLAGVRHSEVRFSSEDHYITADNGNDSGAVAYSHTSPVAGVVWHATKDLNLYANVGNGFETPTFIELAYVNVGTGLNFALQPAISNSVEVGAKGFISDTQRFTLAAYDTKTSNEIIIDSATGGRTTYKNAARTKRHGVEAEWEGVLGNGFTAYASYTYISAKFAEPTTTGTPPLPVPAGARLPAVPANAAYGELAWNRPDWSGFSTAVEFQYADKLYVNDRNTDASAAYAVVNIRAGVEQRQGAWTIREFIRVNNLMDKNYVGSVIVGDTNGRYFEPSAFRNFVAGITVNVKF